MSPLVAYHNSPRRYRDSINRYGLLPNKPSAAGCFGVYVFRDDYTHTVYTTHNRVARPYHLRWRHRNPDDLWEVAYIGPLRADRFVENGLVLLEQPQFTSLVTHLSEVTTNG